MMVKEKDSKVKVFALQLYPKRVLLLGFENEAARRVMSVFG